MLEEMDKQFAKLFEFIKADDQLRGNTMILICSDNGPELGAGQAGALKGYKTHLYEGGIRSSLVVWAPGLMKKNAQDSTNQASVFSAIDLVPSLLKFAGVKTKKELPRDGEDVLDILLGNSNASRQAPLYFSRPPDRKNFYGFQNLPDLAVRQGKWKLLCDYDGARAELYDLTVDPAETKNVAKANPRITKQLAENVMNWFQSMPKMTSSD